MKLFLPQQVSKSKIKSVAVAADFRLDYEL